ncbi:MAG TPA: efflux RND transporter periplasmic adaptor subunit [Candidatus Limnocylindrales bacterium]|nr:efflux RND transporter periplasmic adaptor subunit [Candidatus Limnocylindrales bacterium]
MSKNTKLVIAALVFVGLAALWAGWRHGKTEADETEKSAAETGGVTAGVAQVRREAIAQLLTIAGAFKPFQEIDVHAKVAGYIKRIYVDVGTHVKDGQTLAILEVPELTAELAGADAAVRRSQQEIRRAQGDVERAKSAHSAAHAMYKRLEGASREKAGLVAQQELDNAEAKDLEGEAQISSAEASLSAAQQTLEVAEANQKQYAALTNYMRITAPFTGVVTARYADTGALIAAGTSSSTQSLPVVRLAQVSKLRLVLPIPESLAGQIHLGDPVRVHVQASNQDIVGKVSRFAQSLDMQTRTMETEIDFENTAEKLLPGMYAETVLQLSDRKDVLVVPMEAVMQNAGDARILVVNGQNIVEERKVKLGTQGKSRVEVLSGLTEGERVIVGNQSQFRSGEKVIPKEIKLPDAEAGGAS